MPFRLTNGPIVFMDIMNYVCEPYLDKFGIVVIYAILIYLQTKEEDKHQHLQVILELLQKKLYTKFSKYEF